MPQTLERTGQVVDIQEASLGEVSRNALEILKHLELPTLARLKQVLDLGSPDKIGPQTLGKFLELTRTLDFDLSSTGVGAFKARRGLTHGSQIGPTTAALYAEVIFERLAPKRGRLAQFAHQEASLNQSWTGPESLAERRYLAPLRAEMRRRRHIGSQPVFYDWCGAFVLYCCREAGFDLPDAPPGHFATFALVDAWRDWARARGIWHPRTSTSPQAGDIVVFDWNANGVCDHIGIVTGYSRGSSIIETAEGNRGNRSVAGTRSLNSQVMGFIRLD